MRDAYSRVRDSLATIVVTVFLSVASTGFQSWLALRDLNVTVLAQGRILEKYGSEHDKLVEENQSLAITTARLLVLVEQLNKEIAQLREDLRRK